MRRNNETEQRLLDCALTLFAQKGYAATSVREIIEAAQVTRPVLYYYFESKEALFARLVQATHGDAYLTLERLLQTELSFEARLRSIARGSFSFCAQDPRLPQLLFQVAYGPPQPEVVPIIAYLNATRFALIQRVFQEASTEVNLGNTSPEALTLAFCCLIDQHINVLTTLPHPERRLTPALADGLVSLFLRGLYLDNSQPITLPESINIEGKDGLGN
jgi:AcrR family transcriptional regulator